MQARKKLSGILSGLVWTFVCVFITLLLVRLEVVQNGVAKISPYPQSKVLRKVTFEPVSLITRKAIGSDNWPITWGEDNNQYTAYGDGWGFKPKRDKKLSLGFAKIIGSPNEFRGKNIPSKSGEMEGDGEKGGKASGILMVDGTIYLWIRNRANSQLAWSLDKGRTWERGFRFDVSFGSPTFLNFGRNYEGARDEYVYIYSQDGPSAYESYDHVVMARVPKSKIRYRDGYEFFRGLDKENRPIWTKSMEDRGPLLSLPGQCGRTDVVYNAGIKRYLIAVSFNHEGGWGIFDAPEPWGPWTTVFYTEKWDVPGTHGYRFPAKWMTDEGQTMHLVFSGVSAKGYDAFCVRKMVLSILSHDAPEK